MDTVKRKCMRVWGRCKRCHADGTGTYNILSKGRVPLRKSKRWQRQNKRSKVAPAEGYFSVYVGPERQRFVMKIELANHPLFKTLLDDAEIEYGFHNDGPIQLPCDVDLFCEALAEMESSKDYNMGSAACTCTLISRALKLLHFPHSVISSF